MLVRLSGWCCCLVFINVLILKCTHVPGTCPVRCRPICRTFLEHQQQIPLLTPGVTQPKFQGPSGIVVFDVVLSKLHQKMYSAFHFQSVLEILFIMSIPICFRKFTQNEITDKRTRGTYCCSEAVFEAATQRSAGDFPAEYWIQRV